MKDQKIFLLFIEKGQMDTRDFFQKESKEVCQVKHEVMERFVF